METTTHLLKALSEPGRLRIVMALTENRELCACQITELLRLSGATVSRHLAQLTSCGLLESRKEGRWVFFRLIRSASTAALLSWLKTRLSDDPEILGDTEALRRIVACGPEGIACMQRRNRTPCEREKPGSFRSSAGGSNERSPNGRANTMKPDARQ